MNFNYVLKEMKLLAKFKGAFKRLEIKYIVDFNQVNQLLHNIKDYIVPDAYGRSRICNIYFDTPSFELIRKSIEKPLYKEKLRLRCYGVPNDQSNTFIEIKKKFKKVVYKRRTNMNYHDALDYICNGKKPLISTQITNEIDYFKKFYQDLQPAMIICYDREAFFGKQNSNLRITFDSNIKWRNTDLDLRNGDYGNKLLLDNQAIIEVKAIGSMPLWLTEQLDALKIYPGSYSKYGNAYKTINQQKKSKNEGEDNCAS